MWSKVSRNKHSHLKEDLLADGQQFSFLENLVQDVLIQITLYLDAKDLVRVSLVNKKLCKTIKECDMLWKHKYCEIFLSQIDDKLSIIEQIEANTNTSWYEAFKTRYFHQRLYRGYPLDPPFMDIPWGGRSRVLLLGLDAAGKTNVLYAMKLGEHVTNPIKTIGFNVESIGGLNIWDIGGDIKMRPIWRHYFQNADAVVWVVDAADVKRLEESRNELFKVLQDQEIGKEVPLLVYANKSDLPGALDACTIAHTLHLEELNRNWYVQPCDTKTEKGHRALFAGLGVLIHAKVKDLSDVENNTRPSYYSNSKLGQFLWLACCCGCCGSCLRKYDMRHRLFSD